MMKVFMMIERNSINILIYDENTNVNDSSVLFLVDYFM